MEKIIKTDNASLSEEQKEFYRRIEEIKRLQDELEKLSVQIPKAIQEYTRTIHPIAQKISHLEKLRLEAIDEYCNAQRFSKKELSLIEDYMCYEILFWMHQYGEDELLMDIFQRYAHMPFKEYVSLLHIERSVPAQKTDVGDASNEPEPTNTNSKKKTSSERKIEKEKIEQEKRRKQTVRSIYIDLIKIFHPDTEQDEYKKLEKEEISKRLTEAYAKNDLFTLLKLETDYLENDSSRLAGMHPDTLQAYVTMLANQKKEIESALSVLKTENNLIYVEMCRPSSKPEKFLRKVKKEMNEMTGILDNQIAVLQEHDESIKPYLLDDMEKQFRRKNIDALLSDML